MSRFLKIILPVLFLMSFEAQAQVISDTTKVVPEIKKIEPNKYVISKTIVPIQDSFKIKPFKPDPTKVVWMSAIIPGYGQIMNRKYWKLPIVYGGFLGCAYALTWNGNKYQTYQKAYRDIIDSDPTTNSFLEILPKGYTIGSPGIGTMSTYTETLKKKQDLYRRSRDLSVLISIGFYALTIVDAYVDAQLYDFDISPDLSLRFQPILMENMYGLHNTLGMQCSISLK